MTEVNQKPLSYLVRRTKLNVDLRQVEPDVRKNYQKLSSHRDKTRHGLSSRPSNRANSYSIERRDLNVNLRQTKPKIAFVPSQKNKIPDSANKGRNYIGTRWKEDSLSISISVKPSETKQNQKSPLHPVERRKFPIDLRQVRPTVRQLHPRPNAFSIVSTLTSVPSYQIARLIKNQLSSSYAEFTRHWPFFQLGPAFSRHVHAGIQKRTRLLGERGREGGKRRRKSTRKRKEKGKTVNRCQSTVVPEWSSEMAFGFPAASVAAAAPLSASLLSIASAAFYVDTWLHVCARESARQFFFSPRIDRVTLYAFPPPIPPGGRPFPTTCTCSWNTRTRATAANAFAGKCLPLTRYSHDYASILRVKGDSKERDIFQFVWKWHDFVMGSDELRSWVWACCAIVWNKGSCCFFAMVRILVREEEFKIFGLFGKEVSLLKEISYEF